MTLGGIWAAVLTPCDAAGQIDLPRWVAHGRRLLAQGCHGLALFGTTSESQAYTVAERQTALEAAVTAGLAPARLMVGVGCCARGDTVALARHALALGITRLLVLPPFFYKNNTDEGLYRAFAEAIEGTGDSRLEVLLYHFPQVSGVPVTGGVIERLLATYPAQLRGLKDSSGDLAHTRGLIAAFPGLAIFAGADNHLLDVLTTGGAGTISAAANINAAASRAVHDAFRAGERGAAEAGMELVRDVRAALQRRPLIAGLKAVIAATGGDPAWRRVRPPLVELPEAETDALLAELAVAGWRPAASPRAA
jgi:4-hydroxy-tetrahydrodipicolinate synthase